MKGNTGMKQRYIRQIKLENFRNYIHFEAEFTSQIILLTGANGAGKTNLLEAISLLTPGRGLRRAKFEDMLSHTASHSGDSNSGHWTFFTEIYESSDFDLEKLQDENTKKGKLSSCVEKAGPDISDIVGSGMGSSDTNSFEADSTLTSPLPDPGKAGRSEHSVDSRKVGIRFSQDSTRKRTIRVDGETVSSQALVRFSPVLWLTPAQDRLFVGSASDRRRFFDRLVLAWFSDHGLYVSIYEKAMRQRLAALENRFSPDLISGLEKQMAEFAAKITENRLCVLGFLQEQMNGQISEAFPRADLRLDGLLENHGGQDSFSVCEAGHKAVSQPSGSKSIMSVQRLSERKIERQQDLALFFLQRLYEQRDRDRYAGRTLEGTHRTDFIVTHGKKRLLAKLCSTGEQKALLTGLFLAQARALSIRQHLAPFLLLDEAVAHLDSIRRRALAEELFRLRGQVWLTGTDASLFKAFSSGASLYEVKENQLSKGKAL